MRFTTRAPPLPPDSPASSPGGGDDRVSRTGRDAKGRHCNPFIYPHCLIAPPTNEINYRG